MNNHCDCELNDTCEKFQCVKKEYPKWAQDPKEDLKRSYIGSLWVSDGSPSVLRSGNVFLTKSTRNKR